MLKFFRKIRQNLLSEGKTGRYLKYAIGEIVLVVIGILIALQINNWNENRNNKAIVNKYLNQLLQDFSNDEIYIEKLAQHLASNIEKYNGYKERLEHNELSIDSSIYYIGNLNWLSSTVIFQTNTINTLESSGDIKLISEDIRTKLIALRTIQDRTISTTNLINENYGERIGYANNFSGGGAFIASNSKNSKIAAYYSDEKRKMNWLFALQNSQEVKMIGDSATLNNLNGISEQLKELSRQIKAELNK